MNVTDQPSERPAPPFDEAHSSRLSRFLALILRHRAPQFGLRLDDEGFVDIDDLLDAIDEHQPALDWVEVEHLESLANAAGRKRFEIRDNRIRATYGHSFNRPIHYPTVEPPELLYSGVPKAKMPAVRMNGLRPAGRQYVHLSEDREEALQVGRHQDENAELVTIRAAEAARKGVAFHRPTEGLYLVSRVPVEFLQLAVGFGRKTRRRR